MTADRDDWGLDRQLSLASHRVESTDGVTLAVHELGRTTDSEPDPGPGAGTGSDEVSASVPTVLLCHPTGFHGLVWAPAAAELVAQVTAEPTTVARGRVRCLAIDLRGHGDSTLPTTGSLAWSGMAADVLAVVDALELEDAPLLGVGHSMGGTALFLAEQARPGLLAGIWTFEPIVSPAPTGRALPKDPMAAAARRRKAIFPDRETALANYAVKPPLNTLAPEALAAYVAHGFRDRPDGGVELKCAPETEAQVFEGSAGNGGFEALADVKCPVTVAASGDGSFPARMAATVSEALPQGRVERFEELTHFGPMEDPAAIARSIRESHGL